MPDRARHGGDRSAGGEFRRHLRRHATRRGMEEELDEIEEGKHRLARWRMAEFYEKFEQRPRCAPKSEMTDIKRMEKPTDLICDKCGKPMVIKWGRHGSFIACTGYPECTNTRELTVDLPDVDKVDLAEQDDEEYCENCGRPMVLKKGRFGTFYACSGYPDCKTTKRIGEARERKPDVAARREVPAVRQPPGAQAAAASASSPPAATIPTCKYVKQKTIGVTCPQLRRGRDRRAALQARQDFLRLQPLPGVRLRGLGTSRSPRSAPTAAAPTWSRSG